MARVVVKQALGGAKRLQSLVARQVLPRVISGTIRPLWSSRLPVTWQRRITGALLHNGWVPRAARVSETQLGGVPCELITPAGGAGDRVVLFVHGGGYVVCSPRTHRPLTARLALTLGATTYVPAYRLAPEHAFPAGLNDVLAVYRSLLARGVEPGRIAIMGDSAGGGLALALALSIRDQQLPQPGKLVLISPWTDLTLSGETLRSMDGKDPMLTWKWIIAKTPLYAGLTDAAHPLISPLFADLSGLPPTLVQVGSREILLSDSERLAERSEAAGWALDLQVWDGMWHDFQMLGDLLPEADAAIEAIRAFVAD